MRPSVAYCLLTLFSFSALSTGATTLDINVDPVNAKQVEPITENHYHEARLEPRYEWREEFNQIPAGRLKPAPPDWDPPRWAQYQHELTSGYQACMPTCCGYNDCVADRSYCTDYCLERGHVTGMAINPKTGNMAPPPRMAKRSDNSEDYIERRGITDFPPENLLPCPPDWDRTDWDRYQGALINSFQGCMPNCCGYKRCSNYPDEVPGCQKHCMDMGHGNYAMINPKTGKVAPHPSSHVKRGESASSKNTSGDSTSDSVGLLRHIILILGVFGAPLAIWYVL